MNESGRDQNAERKQLRLENPTLLGKVVGLGSAVAKVVGSGVDVVLNAVADIVVEAEKAFKDGLDPNIEDAKILDEKDRRPSKSRKKD